MPLTGSFRELVQRHVAADRAFAESLLREAVELSVDGDDASVIALLRDCLAGFELRVAARQGG
ncbi:MAG TPA: hypothetical protein VHW66_13655 [Stellaceae bacterium]|jgi:hypothetical protein|nr:hypothetical protein [Stellaceae bacterium]